MTTAISIALHYYQRLQEAEQRIIELELLSCTDSLTQIANRRQFDHMFNTECRRAHREDSPLSLILIDIDHFKTYNDHYGHQQGDECLRKVATAIARVVNRPGDLTARYGGEEFAVVLPNTSKDNAVTVATRIQQEIAVEMICHAAAHTETQILTLSMGAAVLDADMTPPELIERADKNLYAAKAQGRNRIIA